MTPRVLLVEDLRQNRDLFVRLFHVLQCEVDTAVDGEEAVERWRNGVYDIVFMDCMLPGIDGFEAARQIRKAESGTLRPRTPIVAFSAQSLEGEAATADMDDFLRKPVRLNDLAEMIQKWCPRAA